MKADSMTPLGYACFYGHVETVKVLLEFKAPKGTAVGIDWMPPICIAAANGHFKLLRYFVEDLKVRINSKDKFKRTPLILAVMNGYADMASYLL